MVIFKIRAISVEFLMHMRHYAYYNNYVISNVEMLSDQQFPFNKLMRPFRWI